ncbi:N-methyl-L-tryptophan oxidase [compost metagenome]
MTSSFSYWEKQHFFSSDVLIIGSGIVGLTAAIALKTKAPSLRITVLERGFLPAGASTKNAGFACFGSISELIEQEKKCGADGLYQLISRRWKGLLKLRSLLGDKHLGYHCLGGYELFKSEEEAAAQFSVSKMEHFNALISDIVLEKKAFMQAGHKISGLGLHDIHTLIENKLEAQIDTGLMMRSLLKLAAGVGVLILNNCTVETINGLNRGVSLHSSQGDFQTKKVLLTTNAFIRDFFPSLDVEPGRGQVIITNPIPGLKLKGTFHYDRGFYYFRNIDNRVLLGGGRNLNFEAEKTTEFGETPVVQQKLISLLKSIILPGRDFEIEQKWSGIMAFGNTLDPLIKELNPDIFCAVRCNGMGIAMGSQTGEDAAEMLLKSL